MIEINAKENSTVEVVTGDFPIGNRNTILVNIQDPLVNDKLKITGTGTCYEQNNEYTYGQFENENDIYKIEISLNENASIGIVSGIGINYSRCLQCIAKDNGLGTVNMKPDKLNITIGNTYIFSCYFYLKQGITNIIAKDNQNNEIFNINNTTVTDDWVFISQTFTAKEEGFNLYIDIPTTGECYFDNIMLFNSINEIMGNLSINDINVIINILNPCNYNVKNISKIINWEYNKVTEQNSVILFMPEITVLDYKDNILCELIIYQKYPKKVVELGNTIYNEKTSIIYKSEPFILNGYILPN